LSGVESHVHLGEKNQSSDVLMYGWNE